MLPISRNTTYAPNSQVKSFDLNDIQDQIIALYTRINFAPAVGWIPSTGLAAARRKATGVITSSSAANTAWYTPLDGLPQGTLVKAVELKFIEANLAGEVMLWVLYAVLNGTANQLGDVITSGVSGLAQTAEWSTGNNDTPADFPYTLAAGERLYIATTMNQTSVNDEAEFTSIEVNRE